MKTRRQLALEVREAAAQEAHFRPHPQHINNGEEYRYYGEVSPHPDHPNEKFGPFHLANFSKGLPHDVDGFLANHEDYERFVVAIQSGDSRDFKDVPLGPNQWSTAGEGACNLEVDAHGHYIPCDPTGPVDPVYWRSQKGKTAEGGKGAKVRGWESMGAGHQFELEGYDAQAVTMPPAPRLDSEELISEMAEVYVMALLRDLPFAGFHSGGGSDSLTFKQAKDYLALNEFPAYAARYRGGQVTDENVLRGYTEGDAIGPYVSQFLLVGNPEQSQNGGAGAFGLDAGLIRYGSSRIDQRVRSAKAVDYLRDWDEFIDVQNGADFRGLEEYETSEPRFRFISRPRDLATYVHYDALYQAYLNACLLLLERGVPFDRGIPFQREDQIDRQQGFAHFGGPHILTLVTEVATRALKAVRYQKFNVHRRARPEAVAGLLERYRRAKNENDLSMLSKLDGVKSLYERLETAVIPGKGKTLFEVLLDEPGNNLLLPMAFCEGSPMHPAYGAGHATVAGACVTILKAFFDHGFPMDGTIYQAAATGASLDPVADIGLNVEGELNKLAANISIGRNWAGVHYWSDYTESLRMGEQIALGVLSEQKLTYRENFRMTVPLFDGGAVMI